MNKLYKIFFLFILLIFLTTYTPKKFDLISPKEGGGFFNIQKIEIVNNSLISDQKIKSDLENLYGKNIFFIKSKPLEKILNKIDLINKVELKKKYPDTIKVKVYEEHPTAILNKKNKKFFIMESSKLIPFTDNIAFENLPTVFGEKSEFHLVSFLKSLQNAEFPTQRIKNFYFFKIGRWDIQLKDDQVIKFPFKNVNEAINQSIQLMNRKDFVKYKIIDLRISGKIITE